MNLVKIEDWQEAIVKSYSNVEAALNSTVPALLDFAEKIKLFKEYCEENNQPYLELTVAWTKLPKSSITKWVAIGERAKLLRKKSILMPESYSALYEVAKLPEEVINDVEITPAMTTSEIRKLNPKIKEKNDKKQKEKKADTFDAKYKELIKYLIYFIENIENYKAILSEKQIKNLTSKLLEVNQELALSLNTKSEAEVFEVNENE